MRAVVMGDFIAMIAIQLKLHDFLDTFILSLFILKINDFWGDVSDISATRSFTCPIHRRVL